MKRKVGGKFTHNTLVLHPITLLPALSCTLLVLVVRPRCWECQLYKVKPPVQSLAHPFFSFPYSSPSPSSPPPSSPSPSSPSILRCHFKRNMLAKSLKPYLIPGFASFAISGVIQVFRMVLPRECPRQNFSNDQHLQLDCIIIGSHNSKFGTAVLKHFVPD